MERIVDEQHRRARAQTDDELWTALAAVTAERDALSRLIIRQRLPWRRFAWATRLIALLLLALTLT